MRIEYNDLDHDLTRAAFAELYDELRGSTEMDIAFQRALVQGVEGGQIRLGESGGQTWALLSLGGKDLALLPAETLIAAPCTPHTATKSARGCPDTGAVSNGR